MEKIIKIIKNIYKSISYRIYDITSTLINFGKYYQKDFINFVSEKNILGSIIGIIIANYIRDLSIAISNGIIVPILQRIKNDKNNKKLTISILGIKFEFDEIISVLTNMIVILLIIYMMIKIVPRYINRTSKYILNKI